MNLQPVSYTHLNDGFIINAMHSREGCYTYIKEIIDGNSVITLSEEEQEACLLYTSRCV